MREKEEEDNTKQKVPLYTRCSQLTCILIPTQLTCVLIRTSLMQPSLEPTRLPRAKRSRTRCLPSQQTVPTPESNNQIQTFPSNQTFRAPRLAVTCAVTLLARRIARLFSSANRWLSRCSLIGLLVGLHLELLDSFLPLIDGFPRCMLFGLLVSFLPPIDGFPGRWLIELLDSFLPLIDDLPRC